MGRERERQMKGKRRKGRKGVREKVVYTIITGTCIL